MKQKIMVEFQIEYNGDLCSDECPYLYDAEIDDNLEVRYCNIFQEGLKALVLDECHFCKRCLACLEATKNSDSPFEDNDDEGEDEYFVCQDCGHKQLEDDYFCGNCGLEGTLKGVS